MALITRLSRLFQADIHAILDCIEEPDLLLKQTLREMEDQLALDAQHIKYLQRECESLDRRREDARKVHSRCEDEIQFCFTTDNDEFARGLIKRKLESEKIIANLEIEHEEARSLLVEQQTLYQENLSLFEGMRQKVELLVGEPNSPHTKTLKNTPFSTNPSLSAMDVSVNDVEVAFLREKKFYQQKIEQRSQDLESEKIKSTSAQKGGNS